MSYYYDQSLSFLFSPYLVDFGHYPENREPLKSKPAETSKPAYSVAIAPCGASCNEAPRMEGDGWKVFHCTDEQGN